MATRKDQVEAFSFARHRMVANLVVPTPTGSDEGAPRPVRAFITSAILSVLAVAGVAVLGSFKPSAPSGWQNGLAVDSTSGAAYVYQNKELHAVLNITSAKLLLGSSFTKYDVPDSVINGPGLTIGAPFGIPGAPPDVPTAGNVDLTAWNVCVQSANAADQTAAGGSTVVEVGYGAGSDTAVPADSGFVVHDSLDTNYLVDGGYAYKIDNDETLSELHGSPVGSGAEGPWVSAAWLSVFQQGTAISFPTVAGIGGSMAAFGLADQPGGRVGDYGMITGANGQQTGYIETGQGLLAVDDFVYRLYAAGPEIALNHIKQMSLSQSQVDAASSANATAPADAISGPGADWPQTEPALLDFDGAQAGFGVFCADFSGHFNGGQPAVGLYYGTALPDPLAAGQGVPQPAGSGVSLVDVKPGHAALIRAVSNGESLSSGIEYLIPDTGTKYQLAAAKAVTQANGQQGTEPSAVGQLQYGGVAVQPVPQNWAELIGTGAELDPTLAGQTPSLAAQ